MEKNGARKFALFEVGMQNEGWQRVIAKDIEVERSKYRIMFFL